MKVYIETLGCPKNTVDSESVANIMEAYGHQLVFNPDEAEVIMVNTCGFINDAKQESIDTILEMAAYKNHRCELLMVSGCLSQRYGQELFDELPEVDAMIGVNDYHNINQVIEDTLKKKRILTISPYNHQSFLDMGQTIMTPNYTTYLKIAEGCDNRCSYCSIPFIRGAYRSRPFEDILNEANHLAEQGCKEITLVAQDTTNYGIDLYQSHRLPELVREMSKIESINWIRLMYCYPHLITEDLIRAIKETDKVCNYMDIPLQHCNNRLLKAMNRKATKEQSIEAIQNLRKAIPDIHIRTTLIVGLPGETEEEFQELVRFVKDMRFERMGVFTYSPEEGTSAYSMADQIDEEIKEMRRDTLMQLQQSISEEINQSKIGEIYTVLVEEKVDEEDVYIGRTQYDALEIDNAVIFKSNEILRPGTFVDLKIIDAVEYDLIGECVNELTQ
ncbi:MAG: 30S ribosomal protein S12 methylthiotransferase RimO [Clostridia bacterium]|nr:30S ribosomal protein S12 methylthiotransferase RimO [Clostridia bacterium]